MINQGSTVAKKSKKNLQDKYYIRYEDLEDKLAVLYAADPKPQIAKKQELEEKTKN